MASQKKIVKEKIQKTIDYYCKNIKSKKFSDYIKEERKTGQKLYLEEIIKEKPELKNRTDFYDESKVYSVFIGDTLSNDGISKLLKKLYKLPNKKYKVSHYYKKPTLFHKYDYIHLQYSRSGYGSFAKIDFLDDDFIKKIDINWVQVNNYFAFIEYEIWFNKILTDEDIANFTISQIKQLTNKDFNIYYNITHNDESYNLGCLKQLSTEYFQIACQHFITTHLYSEQGKKDKLLNLICYTRKKEIDINTLYLFDFSNSFYNKKENYIIFSSIHNSSDYELLAGGKYLPRFSICSYISNYGNDFFYRFFGYRELQIFEREFSQYTSGRKKISYNKKLLSLLNRLQAVSDERQSRNKELMQNINKNWIFYCGPQIIKNKTFSLERLSTYKKIYDKNFSYLKILTELNYTKSNKRTSIWAVILAVASIIVSFVLAA